MMILKDLFQSFGLADLRVQPVFIRSRLEDKRHSVVDFLHGVAGSRCQDGAGLICRIITGGFFVLPGLPEAGKRKWVL